MPTPPAREGSTVFFWRGIDGSMQRARLQGWRAMKQACTWRPQNRAATRGASCNTRHLITFDIVILDGAVTTSAGRHDGNFTELKCGHRSAMAPLANLAIPICRSAWNRRTLQYASKQFHTARQFSPSRRRLPSKACATTSQVARERPRGNQVRRGFKRLRAPADGAAVSAFRFARRPRARHSPRRRARPDRHRGGRACADRRPATHARPSGCR